jgi:hypothetical protein
MTMERATPHPQVTDVESQALDWNQIYVDLAPRVYNYFRYRLGQEREVEDLTSRTFERAWIQVMAQKQQQQTRAIQFGERLPGSLGTGPIAAAPRCR